MIKILNTKSRNFQSEFDYYLNSRRKYSESKIKTVARIIKDVRKQQDKSLIKYEKKFNSLKNLKRNKLFFSNSEIKKNIKNLDLKVNFLSICLRIVQFYQYCNLIFDIFF